MWTIPTKFPSPQRILIRAKDRLWFSWEQKSWKGSSYHRNPRIRDLEKTQRDINTSKGKFCVGGIDKFGKADKWGRIIVRNVDGCARDVSAAVFPRFKWFHYEKSGESWTDVAIGFALKPFVQSDSFSFAYFILLKYILKQEIWYIWNGFQEDVNVSQIPHVIWAYLRNFISVTI